MHRPFIALGLILLAAAAPGPGLCQGQPNKPDPLLLAVPPHALAAVLVDLRSESESMKVLAAALPEEQRAATRAAAVRSLRQVLAAVGGDLDVEKEILSWLTGRAVFCFIPVPRQREPGMLCVLETEGGDATTASVTRLMQGGVAAKHLAPGDRAGGNPVWKATKLGGGASMSYVEPVFLVSRPDTILVQGLRHLEGINAGAAAAPLAAALASAPPGFVRFALAPQVFTMARNAGAQRMAVNAVAGSARLDKAGIVNEVDLFARPDDGPWQTLVNLKPTFAESIAGIPENALFATVVSRPGVWLHAMGIPILDGIATGELGPPAMRAIGNHLAILLSDLLGQEVAFGVMPAGKSLSWLAVFTSSRPASVAGAMDLLIQSGQAIRGIRAAPAPVGDAPGWVLTLAGRRGGQPRQIHLALVQARVLAAGSREALQAGVSTLTGGARSVATAEWFTKEIGPLGPTPLARSAVNTRAIAPALTGLLPQGGPVPAKAVAPFLEALLGGVGQAGGGVRLEGNVLRFLGFAGLDYPKMAVLANMAIPAVGGLAVARAAKAAAGPGPASAPARVGGDGPANTCAQQMRQLAAAAHQYAREWGKLPPAEDWVDALEPYLKSKALLRCPAEGGQAKTCYAYNRALAEIPMEQIGDPSKVVLFYECVSAEGSPAGSGQDLPNPARHGGKHAFVFVDGHVELAPAADPAWWQPAGHR